MSLSLVCLSPAKLNLFLWITGKLSDGYHTLCSGLQYITFCDTLEFWTTEKLGSLTLEMVSQLPGRSLPGLADNLILRAASKLQAFRPGQLGIHIRLTKRIPIGSGLGGGSSNAATTLLALNHLWELRLTAVQLSAIGRELGADVPFFLYGRSALARGTGEILSPMAFDTPWYLVASCPNINISTAKAFGWITHDYYRSIPVNNKAFEEMPFGNVFESIVRREYPAVDQIFQWGRQFGKPRLTGTGGACFMQFSTLDAAMRCAEARPEGTFVFLTQGLNRSLVNPEFFPK